MYGYLTGKITHKTPTFIYIECGGVGYHVNISLNTFALLDGKTDMKLYTHLQVREDDMSLYGFADEGERALFVLLISVSGVGTNTARIILSYMTIDEVKKAIMNEDAITLSKAKGIGPKTAKRIILDLKEKVIKESGSEPSSNVKMVSNSMKDDALSALMSLGFPRVSVEKTIVQIIQKYPEMNQVEELIKLVLKQMYYQILVFILI